MNKYVDEHEAYQSIIEEAAAACPDVPPGITICVGLTAGHVKGALEALKAGDMCKVEGCLNDALEALAELFASLEHFSKLRRFAGKPSTSCH